MVSIIIPYYKEPYLEKTIVSLKENAVGEIEILSVEGSGGMRAAINRGLAQAKGDFIMKCDAHCIFASGYDKVLTENCAEDWLMIPRRYSLDDVKWVRDTRRPKRDYHYLNFPCRVSGYGVCMSCQNWERRGAERKDPKYDIDDTMTFQGSCWFANRKYFMERVGLLDDRQETYSSFGGEQIEIGLKYWLGGGQNKVIKKTWYAHLSKQPRHYEAGLFTSGYKRNSHTVASREWLTKHWMNNLEPNLLHPFSWLVEKFMPIPGWPEDRNLWVFPE